jgi:hypothetical protein
LLSGFFLLSLVSIQAQPRDDSIHIEGRSFSLNHLWKYIHRHTQRCALLIS